MASGVGYILEIGLATFHSQVGRLCSWLSRMLSFIFISSLIVRFIVCHRKTTWERNDYGCKAVDSAFLSLNKFKTVAIKLICLCIIAGNSRARRGGPQASHPTLRVCNTVHYISIQCEAADRHDKAPAENHQAAVRHNHR